MLATSDCFVELLGEVDSLLVCHLSGRKKRIAFDHSRVANGEDVRVHGLVNLHDDIQVFVGDKTVEMSALIDG